MTNMQPGIIVGDAASSPSMLERLNNGEVRELSVWLSEHALGHSSNLDADSLVDALPAAINLANWPGWATVAERIQADMSSASVMSADLIARLRATRL
ncbi:hypothetical protein [Burkholderia cepacia]|uniref:hypothetical protein n=1 Tax=Burkholderia cepacia TaxID=292 RepID=UPI003EE08D1F